MIPLPPERLGSESLDHDIDRQPVEPGAEGRLAAKASELLPDADEDILRELVGVASAGHAPDETVDLRQVGAIEALEGADVPARGKRHVIRRVRS